MSSDAMPDIQIVCACEPESYAPYVRVHSDATSQSECSERAALIAVSLAAVVVGLVWGSARRYCRLLLVVVAGRSCFCFLRSLSQPDLNMISNGLSSFFYL